MCKVPKCKKKDIEVIWLGKEICYSCWNKYDDLTKVFKVKKAKNKSNI